MVPGKKFYIYGGGRWRELDLSDGRVDGWGRARFVYPKRGKVRVAKTQAVLTGLRDLAAGQKSTVRDGARIPHKTSQIMKWKETDNHERVGDRPHCCQHSNINGCIPSKAIEGNAPRVSIGTQCIQKMDAGIQTSLISQTLTFPGTLNNQKIQKKKRKRSTSSEEDIPTKITTTATVHTKAVEQKHELTSLMRSEEEVNGLQIKRVPSLKLEKADSAMYNLYKRRRKSSDSVVWVVLPKTKKNGNQSSPKRKISEYLKPKSKRFVPKRCSDISGSKKTSKFRSRNKISSEDHVAKKSRNNHKQQNEQKSSGSDEQSLNLLNNNLELISSNKENARLEQCKEIIIDESDVDILRNYLINHASDFDLLKFDQDDEYKKHFFFKINPLVNVERCPKIAKILGSKTPDDISLKEFASQLGLRSVTDRSSQPRRYKMRRLHQKRSYLDGKFSDSETNKENAKEYLKKKDRGQLNSLNKSHHKQKKYISTSKIHSTASDSKSSESHFNRSPKKTIRSDGLLKESNRARYNHEKREITSSKKYKKRKSDNTKSYDKESTESNTEDSNSEFEKSLRKEAKELKKINGSQIFSSKHRSGNLDDTSNDKESISSDENSDIEELKESRILHKKRNDSDLTVTDSSEEDTDFAPYKLSKKVKLKPTKELKQKGHDKTNNNSYPVKNKKDISLELDDDQSDVETSKSLKAVNKKVQIVMNDKSNEINIDTASKPSKELIKNNQRKVKYDKMKDTNHSSSDCSVIEDSQLPKNKTKQNKAFIKSNDIEKSRKDQTDSDEEFHKSTRKLTRKGLELVSNSKKEKVISKQPTETSIRKISNIKDKKSEVVETSKPSKDDNRSSKNKSNNESTVSMKLKNDSDRKNSERTTSPSKIPIVKVTSVTATPKRSLSAGNREYSNLEDHAIVSWISSGGRARCVNGNRIWRDLEGDFSRIAGQKRSWHSLRNRYLRYILPSLGSLALPHDQVTRLRAAAATGEIKNRKLKPQRNSIFEAPSRGALSRRVVASRSSSVEPPPPPKRHKHDNTVKVKSPSPKRMLRSSLASPQLRNSPLYTDITRRFADTRHKDGSTPTSSPKKLPPEAKATENLSASKTRSASQDTSHKKQSPTTKSLSLRRSFRNTPGLPATEKSPEKEKSTRSRKLFNPGSVL